jgi:hypothetical protein
MGSQTAYIGLDVHSETCTMSWMNSDGEIQGTDTFATSEKNLIEGARGIEAQTNNTPCRFWADLREKAIGRRL